MSDPVRALSSGGDAATAAERWLARHDRGLSPAEATAFAAWRAASPDHAAEFDRLQHAWQAADLTRADPELAALAARLDATTSPAHSIRRARRRRLTWAATLTAAAAAITFAFLQPWADAPAGPSAGAPSIAATVEVTVPDARRLVLPDGSVVLLRGTAEIEPRFTAAERRVHLTRGEAHFWVQKDPARPFVVTAHELGVRAVGTAFNVKRAPDAIDVVVTEGRIALDTPSAETGAPPAAPPQAQAGQRARVAVAADRAVPASVAVTDLAPAELDRALEWQVARLTLRRATLADALAAFNEHAGTRFELADPALASRQVSGTFRADRAEVFVRLLEQAAEVRAERLADGRTRLHAAQ